MKHKQVTYSSHPNAYTRRVHAQGEKQFRTYDTSGIRPKQSKAPIIVGIVVVIVAILMVVAVVFAVKGCTADTSSGVDGSVAVVSADTTLTIPNGLSADDVATLMETAGVVPSGSDFLSRARDLDKADSLISGTYTFTAGMTLDEVIEVVTTPGVAVEGTPMTIPEGYTLAAIASTVEETTEGRVTADDFTAAASDASVYAADYDFLADAGTNSLEGFLFPKTYDITDQDTADSIIRKMLDQYSIETADLDWSYAEKQGLSQYQALILASIVEKESSGDADIRAQVAGVFYNRLAGGGETAGYLQSDATTAYYVGHDPSAEEVHADNAYSTYTNQGLTPTPICNPGIDCINAVCNPTESDYYYFYFAENADGEMEYYFAKTYDEHQQNIATATSNS